MPPSRAHACAIAASAAALLAAAGSALAQDGPASRTLQFDLNNLLFLSFDSQNRPAPFSGLNFTGSFQLTFSAISKLDGILARNGGPGNPFVNQAFTGGLSDVAIYISLVNGHVVGSYVFIDLNGGASGGGDTYASVVTAGGSVQDSLVPTPGSFLIDGLTNAGHFNDNSLAGIPIGDFYNAQGVAPGLTGQFVAFKITPPDAANGKGFCDLDIFVTTSTIPTPGAVGLLTLAGVLVARRRAR